MATIETPICDKLLVDSKVCIEFDQVKRTLHICEACDYYFTATVFNKFQLQEFIKELQLIEGAM
jgi:hypothetical protein